MVCGFEDVLAFFMQASRQAVRSGNNAGLRSIRQQNELLYKAVRSIYLLLRSFLIVPILLSDLVSLPSGFRTVPAGRPRSFSIFPPFLSRLTFPGAFPPSSYNYQDARPVLQSTLHSDVKTNVYLLLIRGTSQTSSKMIPITSKTQSNGPAMKWRRRPSNHTINKMTPIITSNLNILTSFYLSALLTWPPSKVSLFGYYTSLPDNNALCCAGHKQNANYRWLPQHQQSRLYVKYAIRAIMPMMIR